jgi:hypothetical protein
MNEDFLQFIWQHQLFDFRHLKTVDGLEVQVIHPGHLNIHSGPDFELARVRIGTMEWAGRVEIHVQDKDWDSHGHQGDPSYENVVLHVVYQYNGLGPTHIPVLELKSRIDHQLWERYSSLKEALSPIPCAAYLPSVSGLTLLSMKERALVDRLQLKAERVNELFQFHKSDWEQTVFRMISGAFGFQLNRQPFEQMATALPFHLILKYRDQPRQVEALLFGISGLLQAFPNEQQYIRDLKAEYLFLKKKHNLTEVSLIQSWKFGRMRPPNFPTLKMAQLSQLLIREGSLFQHVREVEKTTEWDEILKIGASDFWSKNYLPSGKVKKPAALIGKATRHLLIINTICPILAAYSHYTADQRYMDRAIRFLEELPAEDNTIIRNWQKLTLYSSNAFDSQAYIQLFKYYCQPRKCLNCQIGTSILYPKVK